MIFRSCIQQNNSFIVISLRTPLRRSFFLALFMVLIRRSKDSIWEELIEIAHDIQDEAWDDLGDFNSILQRKDRFGGT